MKIDGVLQKDDYFYVTFVPTWWERFMGIENAVAVYKQLGRVHKGTYEPVYIDKNGNILNPESETAIAITKFIRKKLFHDRDVILNVN